MSLVLPEAVYCRFISQLSLVIEIHWSNLKKKKKRNNNNNNNKEKMNTILTTFPLSDFGHFF